MDALGKTLAGLTQAQSVRMMPCRIVSTSPPRITIEGVELPALFIVDLTYTPTAPAVAFVQKAGTPLVVPVIGA